jgi:uncharacterized protein (DUF362 family)
MKNWFGILGGSRERLHQRIHESLADLADYLRPTLTILDAWRVLMRNGPTGGSLADVELRKTIVAGTDPVAVDAYAAKAYWNLDAAALPYLKLAADRGLGTTDFESLLKRVASRAGRQPSRYAEAFESASCCALAFTACMSSLPVPSDGRAST